jgi:hypothetical protein
MQYKTPGVFTSTTPVTDPAPLTRLKEGFCPDCGGDKFNRGPRAGLSMNVQCATCGSKFCFSPPFTPERIDNSNNLYGSQGKTLIELDVC